MAFDGDVKAQTVLLFGPPGAGKGTIGEMICAAGNHFHLSSGQIFRHLSPESENGRLVHEHARHGKLVPDPVTIDIWRRYTQGLIDTNRYFPGQQLLLLDGIPRTPIQRDMLKEYVDILHVIVLDVKNPELLVQRITRRARIEKRLDDANEEVVRRRIQAYHDTTRAVLNTFTSEQVKYYNAEQTPMEVLRDVLVGSTEVLKRMPQVMPAQGMVQLEHPPIAQHPA